MNRSVGYVKCTQDYYKERLKKRQQHQNSAPPTQQKASCRSCKPRLSITARGSHQPGQDPSLPPTGFNSTKQLNIHFTNGMSSSRLPNCSCNAIRTSLNPSEWMAGEAPMGLRDAISFPAWGHQRTRIPMNLLSPWAWLHVAMFGPMWWPELSAGSDRIWVGNTWGPIRHLHLFVAISHLPSPDTEQLVLPWMLQLSWVLRKDFRVKKNHLCGFPFFFSFSFIFLFIFFPAAIHLAWNNLPNQSGRDHLNCFCFPIANCWFEIPFASPWIHSLMFLSEVSTRYFLRWAFIFLKKIPAVLAGWLAFNGVIASPQVCLVSEAEPCFGRNWPLPSFTGPVAWFGTRGPRNEAVNCPTGKEEISCKNPESGWTMWPFIFQPWNQAWLPL